MTAEDGAMPVILRIRNQPPPFAEQMSFPHLLAIAWSFDPELANGMPVPEEAGRMAELEDLLERGLEAAQEAFLTVAVTGNGVREWQWYARNPDDAMQLLNKTLGHLDPFPIEISVQDDPEWEGYNGFIRLTVKHA